MQISHHARQTLLTLLLPLLVATEFIDTSGFVFAAGPIAHGLGLSAQELAWLLAAPISANMLMISMQQWLTRHFGYRRYLSAALLLVLLGAAASALAGGLYSLLAARWVLGLGAGALFTSSRILVVLMFAKQNRPEALRRYIGLLFGLSALGPVLAAHLLQIGGWRAVFLAPVPLAALSLVGVAALLPEGLGRYGPPVRWAATPLLLMAIAAALLQLGLAQAREPPEHSHLWLGLTAAGILLLAGFALHQKQQAHPLLNWQGLHHPVYLMGLLLYFLYYLVANASNYLFPIMAEQVLALPLATVGSLSSLAAAASFLAALAYLRFGARWQSKRQLLALAAGLMALSCWRLATLEPHHAAWAALLPALAAKGLFGALFVLPLASLTFKDLGDERFGPGYQSKNLLRHLGISIGTAAAGLSLAGLQAQNNPADLAQACSSLYQGLAWASLGLLGLVLLQRQLR